MTQVREFHDWECHGMLGKKQEAASDSSPNPGSCISRSPTSCPLFLFPAVSTSSGPQMQFSANHSLGRTMACLPEEKFAHGLLTHEDNAVWNLGPGDYFGLLSFGPPQRELPQGFELHRTLATVCMLTDWFRWLMLRPKVTFSSCFVCLVDLSLSHCSVWTSLFTF